MSRIILIMAFLVMGQMAWAQLSEEELQRELDRMEEQMSIVLKRMQEQVENGQLFQQDTSIFRMFPYDGAQEPGFHPQGDPLQLQQLLDEFMGQFTAEDWAELNRIFDEFQQGVPAPDGVDPLPEGEGKSDAPPAKRKKNRKVYSL